MDSIPTRAVVPARAALWLPRLPASTFVAPMAPDVRADPASTLSRRTAAWIVGALTVAALALRLVGLGHQLPHKPEPDAAMVWQAAWLDRPEGVTASDTVQLAPYYPYLFAYALAALPGHAYRQVLPPEAPLKAHLAAASEPYRRARLLVACLSVLLIPATYRLARRFLARGPACFAAALVATSLLDTYYAQQARPHAAAASLSAIAVLCALRHLRRGGLASLAWASLAAFVAGGALHNGVFVFPALALAWWFAPRRRAWGILVPLAAGALALAVFYPFLFTRGLVSQRDPEKLDIGGQTLTWEQISFDGLPQIAQGLWNFDPVLSALAAVGLVVLGVAFARRAAAFDRRALLVTAAMPTGFALFWSVMQVVWPRFSIPLLPFAATLGAGAAAALVGPWLARVPRAVPALAVAAVVALPAYASARVAWLRAQPDTQTLAARWVEAGARPGADRVGLSFLLSLPLLRTHRTIEALPRWARGPWEQYQLDLPEAGGAPRWDLVPFFTPGALADKVIDRDEVLAVLREHPCALAIALRQESGERGGEAVRAVLRELAGPPEQVWMPYPPALEARFGDAYELPSLERVLATRTWGLAVEGYRLERK
jgi:hypothetical protein